MDIGNRECYVGMLYACYDLIRPDVILELSWRHGLNDFTMPYLINLLSNQTKELAVLKADNEARKAREKEQEKVRNGAGQVVRALNELMTRENNLSSGGGLF